MLQFIENDRVANHLMNYANKCPVELQYPPPA